MPTNENIKTAGEEVEFTPEQIFELKRCYQDYVYCIKTYFKVQYPGKGLVPFELYDYQEKMINTFQDPEIRDTIILSARQTGKTVTTAAYILCYSMFNFDQTILVVSDKADNSKEIIRRIKTSYEELPNWLKPGITPDGWNAHSIVFDNGSRIISRATTANSGRSLSISLLYCLGGENTIRLRNKKTGIVKEIPISEAYDTIT